MMAYFAEVDEQGFVLGVHHIALPAPEGQETPPIEVRHTAVALNEMQYLEQPTPTSKAVVQDGELVWIETGNLADLQAKAIAKTYKDVDLVYDDAIGSREKEYIDAEAEARRFAAAGYTGEVNTDVSAYAQYNFTGTAQSNQWAADQIIYRAEAFAAAKSLMRSVRFERQAQMQAASTPEELATAVTAWRGFISGLRSQLGLPPVP